MILLLTESNYIHKKKIMHKLIIRYYQIAIQNFYDFKQI